MNVFAGCTAVITGASSGLGQEFARQLAPQAGCLILVARRADLLEQLRSELARPGLEVRCRVADLADEAQTAALVAALSAGAEPITVLINNAGLGDHGWFEESDWAKDRSMIEVNIRALTQLTRGLLPGFIRRGQGAILNVSSVAGLMPLPKMTVYAASKAYVTSFSEALRGELRGTGVSVTALCPGPVNTGFFALAERANAQERMPAPDFFKVPPERVVREALLAVLHDRARIIPGWLICFVMSIATLVPIFILRLTFGQRRSPAGAPAAA